MTSWPGCRGIVPRRFVALVPIPELLWCDRRERRVEVCSGLAPVLARGSALGVLLSRGVAPLGP